MIQPTSKVFSYTPFKVSFILSFIMLSAWIGFFIAANVYCADRCLYNYNFMFSCTDNGSLYCCSLYDKTGPYYCSYYSSCIFDNDNCGTLAIIAWVSGSILIVTLMLMVFTAYKFNRLKQEALSRQQLLMAPQNYGYPQGNLVYYQNPNPNYQNNYNPINPPANYPQR